MISLDTNVIIRFLTQDEPAQSKLAADLISSLTIQNPGYICREVMIEIVWILERSCKYQRTEICGAIEGLLTAKELVIESADAVSAILNLYEKNGFGFSDLMIREASQKNDASPLLTFDEKAALLDGVELVATAITH